jgi:hypothetical protein
MPMKVSAPMQCIGFERLRTAAAATVVLLSCLAPTPAAAQFIPPIDPPSAPPPPEYRATLGEESRYAGANMLLGAVTAGIAAGVRRDAILPALARGASGGALVYAGKRVAVDPSFGTGLVGRQISSVGGSIIGNQVMGRGSFDRIALAAGPLRVYVGRGVDGVHWALDVPGIAAVAVGLATGGSVDVPASLSSGAVVVRHSSPGIAMAAPGTIVAWLSENPERREYMYAHEQTHVLQYDQTFLSWGGPFEEWVAEKVPGLRGTLRHLEFNLPVLAGAAAAVFFVWREHADQPWEREAIYLGRTR